MLTLTNARIFDGLTMLPGRRTVTLDGNRITSVSEDGKLARAGERIDLGGMTLMPGMISCHLHSDNYKWGIADFIAGDRLGQERPPRVMVTLRGRSDPAI